MRTFRHADNTSDGYTYDLPDAVIMARDAVESFMVATGCSSTWSLRLRDGSGAHPKSWSTATGGEGFPRLFSVPLKIVS